MSEESPQAHHPRRHSASDHIGLALVAVVVIGLLSAPIYAVINSRSSHDQPRMTMGDIGGSPLELATLRSSLARLYRGAKSHRAYFEKIPCFCGCQEGRLQHRNLFDCYVLKDGRGWESHATGCDVCQGEAEMALDLMAHGSSLADVKTQIVDEYGMSREIRDLQEG